MKINHKIVFILVWLFYVQVALFGLGSSWQKIETVDRYLYLAIFPIAFNLNLFVLIPFFLKSRQYLNYVLGSVALILILYFARGLVQFVDKAPVQGFFAYTQSLSTDGFSFSIFLAYVFSFAYRFSRDWWLNNRKIEELEEEKSVMAERIDKIKTEQQASNAYIFVNTGHQKERIMLADLLYIEASGNYVTYFTENENYLVRTGIKAALDELPKSQFCQIHRSTIVSLAAIDKIYDNNVFISDKVLPVSKSFKVDLAESFKT